MSSTCIVVVDDVPSPTLGSFANTSDLTCALCVPYGVGAIGAGCAGASKAIPDPSLSSFRTGMNILRLLARSGETRANAQKMDF